MTLTVFNTQVGAGEHSQGPRLSARRGYSKTKTGCRTCKNRRIKCDEGKPECHRCLKSSLTCEGYDVIRRIDRQAPVPLQKSQSASGAISIHRPLQQLISESPKERQYFYAFCQGTRDMSFFFNSDFWSRVVPMAGHSSPSVKHSMNAIAAFMKTLEGSGPGPGGKRKLIDGSMEMTKDDHLRFGLSQYDKAIKSLQSSLAQKNSNINTTLITCLLFVCLEILQGNHISAAHQIFSGIGLLKSLAPESGDMWVPRFSSNRASTTPLGSRKTSNLNAYVDTELTDIFRDLNVQNYLVGMRRYLPPSAKESTSSVLECLPDLEAISIPLDGFGSVEHAKSSLKTLLNGACLFHSDAQITVLEESRLREIYDSFSSALQLWLKAYQSLLRSAWMQSKHKSMSCWAWIPTLILMIDYNVSLILLRTAMTQSEMAYDNVTVEFTSIIITAEAVINALNDSTIGLKSESSRSQTPTPSPTVAKFSFEATLIPALHITAGKCRRPDIRRKAIELLSKCPVEEGQWDSTASAMANEWLMSVEEEHMRPGWAQNAGPDVIPETKRVLLGTISCDLDAKTLFVECKSALPGEDGIHKKQFWNYNW